MSNDTTTAQFRRGKPGDLVASRVSGITGELLPDAGDEHARFRSSSTGITVVCDPADLEPASVQFVTDQAPGSVIVDLGGGDHVTVPTDEHDGQPVSVWTNIVARNVIRHMQHGGRSLVDLAGQSGMSPHDLAASLAGRRDFYLFEAVLLGLALGLSVGAILDGTEAVAL